MRTVPYSQVLARAVRLSGLRFADLTTEERELFGEGINLGLRKGWEFADWPELRRIGECRYRADYDVATTYAEGDQVWSTTEEAYFEAAQASTGQAVTNTTYWTPLAGTDWAIYVPWSEDFVPEGSTVLRVTQHDPRVKAAPRPVDFRLGEEGIFPAGDVPSSLWVTYRARCPDWLGDDYDAAATYAAGERIYYTLTAAPETGDFWECLTATSAGESPESAAAKWSRIEIPWRIGDAAARRGAAEWLGANGQHAKMLALITQADDALAEQYLRHAGQSVQYGRIFAGG